MKLKTLALLALSLLTVLSFALLSSATDAEPDYSDKNLRIISKNLSYRDAIHILVACDNDGVAADKVELLVWDHEPESASEPATYTDNDSIPYYDGKGNVLFESVFETYGIAAKDMPDCIYMATHIKGTDVYSDIYRYSPLEYLYERIALGPLNETLNDKQSAFYDAIIAYAENAQIVLNHDTENLPSKLNYVAVKGGTLSDGYAAGTYIAGSEITISANSPDDFSMWTNANGEVVSYEPTFTTTASDKTSLFISVSGYTVTVNVGDKSTTTVHVPGDVVTISAPVYADANGARTYFAGWKTGSGEIISGAATTKITVTATETYTAVYSNISDIEGSTLLDYQNKSQTPILSDSPTSNMATSSDYVSILRRNSTSGYYIRIETRHELIAPMEYVNTIFDGATSASSSVFSFDFKVFSSGFEGNADSDTIYTLIFITGNVTRRINVNTVTEDGEVKLKLVDESGKALADIGFDEIYTISVEVSKLGDKTLSAIYVGDEMIDLSEADGEYMPSSNAYFSICTGRQTNADIYIDNTVFYSPD